MLEIEFAELSDCGPVRAHNEDYVGHLLPHSPELTRNRGYAFVLADGVGGQERGEVASRLTVETVLSEVGRSAPGESPSALLTRAVQSANTAVYAEGHGNIASTVVACVLRFDRITVAHAGDSRCYLLRRGRLEQLTEDHSMATEHRKLGLGVMRIPGMQNMLTRSVGSNMFVTPEINEYTLYAGDILLLCSDGLHGAVAEQKIASITTEAVTLADNTRQLVEIANATDGGDNVSVQLIRVKAVEAVGMYRGRPYRLH